MATRIKRITIGTPLASPAATFLEFDSGDVIGIVDSAYVQIRQSGLDTNAIINLIDSDYVQVRQDYAYGSLTGAPTNVSEFTNDVNYTNPAGVQSIVTSYGYATPSDIDSSFVQSRQYTYNLTQGVGATTIAGDFIPATDSTYSLGSPTNKFKDLYLSGNTLYLGDLLLKADNNQFSVLGTDGSPAALSQSSNFQSDITNLIDSGYVQARQAGLEGGGTTISYRTVSVDGTNLTADIVGDKFSLVSGTGITLTPDVDSTSITVSTTALLTGADISSLTNDANYVDSAGVQLIVDSNYINSLVTIPVAYGDSDVQLFVDSNYVRLRQNYAWDRITNPPTILDSAQVAAIAIANDTTKDSAFIVAIVDSAYVTSRVPAGVNIDSAYVQARQILRDSAWAYSFGFAEPGQDVSQFINDANYLDSITVIGVIDAAYIQANQTDFLDSAQVINLVDSAYVQARQDIFDSYNARQALFNQEITWFDNNANFTDYDSIDTLGIVDSAYILGKLTAPELRQKASVTPFASIDFGGIDGLGVINLITHETTILQSGPRNTHIYGNLNPFKSPYVANVFADPRANEPRYLGEQTNRWDRAYIQDLYVGNIRPHVDGIYDIGDSNLTFKTGYFATNTLSLGGLLMSATTDASGNLNLAVTDDPTTTPVSIPNETQTQAITQDVIATSSLLQDMSNVDANPTAGSTIMYDGANFIYVDYKTQAEIRAMFSGGTGVTYDNGEISIGQPVGTSDNVTFNDMTITGDLTVSGTTTTVNSTTLDVADLNITVASGAASAAAANGAGLTINGANATLTYVTVDDRFAMNKDLATNLVGDVTGTVSDISNHSTTDLTEGTNLYYTDERARLALSSSGDITYNNATGVFEYTQPTTVSTFDNDANYLDSTTVIGVVDSAYVQARQLVSTYNDSNVRLLVDSAYVDARVSSVDSAQVINIIELEGYTKLDSSNVTDIVDSAYVSARASVFDNLVEDVNGDIQVAGNLLPGTDVAFDLGSRTKRWRDLYLSASSLYIDNLVLSADTDGNLAVSSDDGNGNLTPVGTIPTVPEAQAGVQIDSDWVLTTVDSSYVQNIIDSAHVRSKVDLDLSNYDNSTAGFASAAGIVLQRDIDTGTLSINSETDAAAVRTLIDVDVAGTDNSTEVTLAGLYDYLTISGQEITLNRIDATTDILNLSAVATSGDYNNLINTPTIPEEAAIYVDGINTVPSLYAGISAASVRNLIGALAVDSIGTEITSTVDSAYVSARQVTYETAAIYVDGIVPALAQYIDGREVRNLIGAIDSAAAIDLIDSDHVLERVSYSTLPGAPGDLNEFTNASGFLKTNDLTDIDVTSYIYTVASNNVSIWGGSADDNGNNLSYDPDTVSVYLNGVKLIKVTDFATNGAGSTITFQEPPVIGDVIEVLDFGGQVLLNTSYISISALKSLVDSSADFADFKTRIANL